MTYNLFFESRSSAHDISLVYVVIHSTKYDTIEKEVRHTSQECTFFVNWTSWKESLHFPAVKDFFVVSL